MKSYIFLFFICISNSILSQEVLKKTFEANTNEIEIATFGLDEVKILNADSNKIEVHFFDENPNAHAVTIEEAFGVLKIDFNLDFLEDKSTVFRKFITKRIHRASAIVKIPKNKTITIHGEHVDVISKNYHGDLKIYIDKGLVNLHKVQSNVAITLFQGNIFAETTNTNSHIKSNNGRIKVNDTIHQQIYKQEKKDNSTYFKVNSINANITLLNNFK